MKMLFVVFIGLALSSFANSQDARTTHVECVSVFQAFGKAEQGNFFTGPGVVGEAGSLATGGPLLTAKTQGYPNIIYDVGSSSSEVISIFAVSGKGKGGGYSAQSYGTISNDQVVHMDYQNQDNIDNNSGACKIGWWKIACAAKANAAVQELEKETNGGYASAKTLPKNCIF